MTPGEVPALHLDLRDPEWSRLQSRIWDPEVGIWLRQLDIQQGWQCVDLGCGAMGILEPLSSRCGATGRIIGLEPRAALFEAAREFIHRGKLDNVRLLNTEPDRTTLPDESFHLVHERFLLSAGWNEDELLAEMLRLTRPGGIIALQEPDTSAWHSHPDRPAWTRLRDAVRNAFSTGGGDIDAGCRTFALLRGAGLEDVRIRAATSALQGIHPNKGLLVELARSQRERMTASGAMAERELDDLIAECDRLARDPETVVVSFLMTQVWARKPRTGRRR